MRLLLTFSFALGLILLASVIKISSPELSWLLQASIWLSGVFILVMAIRDYRQLKPLFYRQTVRRRLYYSTYQIVGLIVFISLAYLSTRVRFNLHYDVTQTARNTLSDESKALIARLNKDRVVIKIDAFFQSNAMRKTFKGLIEQFFLEEAHFEIHYIHTISEPTKAIAAKLSSPNTVIVKYRKKESHLSIFTEEKFTNAILRVLKPKSRTISFLQGHGEAAFNKQKPLGVDVAVKHLKLDKYQVNTLDLLHEGLVPEETELLIIVAPKYDFKPLEIDLLRSYLDRQKSIFLLVDAITNLPMINKFLAYYALKIQKDLLVLKPDDPKTALFGRNHAVISSFDEYHPITKEFANHKSVAFLLPFTRSISFLDEMTHLKKQILVKTEKSMLRIKNINKQEDLATISSNQIEQGSFSVLALVEGKKSFRLAVAGSSYFARNAGFKNTLEYRELFMNTVNYLLRDEDFISIRPKTEPSPKLDLTSSASRIYLLIITYVLPFFVLGISLFIWIRRRRV